jgi:SAM-dependent methyltransferase
MKNITEESFKWSQESIRVIEKCANEIIADSPDIADWFKKYAHTQRDRIAFDYEFVKKNCTKESIIVEIASIPLLLTIPLKKANYNIIGVDIYPERFRTTIQRFLLDIRKCDIENEPLPFPDNFCDYILFNEIFEHLRIDLIFTMKEVLRILRPGGRLFLSTRNLHSLVGIKNFVFKKIAQSGSTDIYNEYSKLESIGHMGHVREYTSTEVSNFLIKIGFEMNALIYRGKYQSFIDNLIIKVNPRLRPYYTCIAHKPISR